MDDRSILNALVRDDDDPAPGELAWVARLGHPPDVTGVLEAALAVALVEGVSSRDSALALMQSRLARIRATAPPVESPPVLRLDESASLARTAITDPDSLPEGWETQIGDWWGACYPRGKAELAFAVDRLDDIIEALNPSTETREAFAAGLRVLGGHVAELQDKMRGPAEDDPEPERSGYLLAVRDIEAALIGIDGAIAALGG